MRKMVFPKSPIMNQTNSRYTCHEKREGNVFFPLFNIISGFVLVSQLEVCNLSVKLVGLLVQ